MNYPLLLSLSSMALGALLVVLVLLTVKIAKGGLRK